MSVNEFAAKLSKYMKEHPTFDILEEEIKLSEKKDFSLKKNNFLNFQLPISFYNYDSHFYGDCIISVSYFFLHFFPKSYIFFEMSTED